MDGKGEFHIRRAEPLGGEPHLGAPDPRGHAQTEQMTTNGLMAKAKHKLGLG
jgi:Mn-containing catalase